MGVGKTYIHIIYVCVCVCVCRSDVRACKLGKIYGAADDHYNLDCSGGADSCYEMQIYTSNSASLNMLCTGDNSCEGGNNGSIQCPASGNCNIYCEQNKTLEGCVWVWVCVGVCCVYIYGRGYLIKFTMRCIFLWFKYTRLSIEK